jgi:hypothetical protein
MARRAKMKVQIETTKYLEAIQKDDQEYFTGKQLAATVNDTLLTRGELARHNGLSES